MHKQPLILYNCIIVTVDGNDTIYHDGMLIVDGGLIQYVGDRTDPLPQGQHINMHRKIVLPGLINTHTHSPSSLFRGFGDDLFLMDWLQNYMWPIESYMSAEDAYDGACLSYLEFLRNGMTTNVDMWYFADSLAKAAMHVGLRSFVAAGVFAWPTPQSPDSLRDADDFVAKYSGKSEETLIYPCYGPHDAYSCNQDQLRQIAILSKKRNTALIHAHLSETEENNNEILTKYKVTPTKYFQQTGVFEHRFLGAHCIWLSDDDISVLSDHDAGISYNPVSNLKLCDGILDVRRIREANVRVTLGVDGAQSNNSLDLLSDQKTGVLIQKMKVNDPTFFSASEAVRMLTMDGAVSLGMDSLIGSLEVGKQADIISLDTNDLNLSPLQDDMPEMVNSHITYSATGSNVCDVFVAGRQLLKDKQPIFANVEEITKRAQSASTKLYRIWKNR